VNSFYQKIKGIKTKTLNICGLVFGIVGVLIIFKFGPPQPSFNPYTTLRDDTINQNVLGEKATYEMLSRIGLGFIAVGFGCQLIATIKSK
jgi:hypothetical protein